MIDFQNVLIAAGVLSGILSLLAFWPYLLDTFHGRTEPQRASWLIWSVLGSIAFFSQVYEGATSSLWFAGAQVGSTISVFAMSVRRGFGRFLRKVDWAVLCVAALGLALWYLTKTAAYALAITISISLIAGCLTVAKCYKQPSSETLSTWIISFGAAILAILAVDSFDPVLIAYPAYLFTLYGMFIISICLGRRREAVLIQKTSEWPR